MVQTQRKGRRYFVLVKNGREVGIYTAREPRRAALKVARRGEKSISLRERGTGRVHIYRGARKKIAAPSDRPDWLPARVWQPSVRKVRIVHTGAARRSRASSRRRPARRR